MDEIIIRNATRDDIGIVVDIQVSGWQTAYKGIVDDEYLNSMSKEEKIKKREEDFDSCGFIVAEINGKVVGFCRYIDSNENNKEVEDIDCELLALYVDYRMKNKGIGRRLFTYVTDEFKRKNKKKMILWCFKDNESAKGFYVKMGGKLSNEKAIEFGGKKYLEIAFEYDL